MKPDKRKTTLNRLAQTLRNDTRHLACSLAELAELPFRETESSAAVASFLENNGFVVDFAYPNVPTAFRATRGSGKPVIGILGEYDALPDCGPRPGTPGHGCGHNLLGTGAAMGAVMAAALLEKADLPGTVVYYGCPAEEATGGKAFMARDGAFAELDACLSWHPATSISGNYGGGSALDSVSYTFGGKTAHGSFAHGGRSALDAAILFDVAVNYLREHVPEQVRIHSVIVDGGNAPNVVPARARSWYYIRGIDRTMVDDVRRRVDLCARAAASATETTVHIHRLTALYNRLVNDRLFDVVLENLELFGRLRVTADDRKRAAGEGLEADIDTTVHQAKGDPGRASTDDDTVSWLTPLGSFRMITHWPGTQGHHRQLARQVTWPLALRGMEQAAKVFASTVVHLCGDPQVLREVRREFKKRTRGFTFDPLISKKQTVDELIELESR
ncbi:MAG: amidohydrolase [Planctomycetota bacterium]